MPNAVGRKCQVLKVKKSATILWVLVRQHPAVVSELAETETRKPTYQTGKDDNEGSQRNPLHPYA
jgi:hypothetical protein